MSGLSWVDIFLRLIPEALIIILAGYAVSKKTMNAKLYLLSSVIQAATTFLYKSLPVSAALPMILSAVTAVLLLVFINKIKVVHAIISTTACLLLSLLIEGLNLFVLEFLHVDTAAVFKDATPFLKNLYGLPSLFLFAAIVIVYFLISRKRKIKNESVK